MDDLLRSLIVVNSAGTVEGLRLPARDLTGEAFRGLPLQAEDFDSRARLLAALRGQEAEAGNARGRIADATEVASVAGAPGGLRLTLITPRGLVTVLLREGDEVKLLDEALAARVARAAEALAAARTADERRIDIRLRADRARQVAVLYVAGAPLWKPSYRLLVPALRPPAAPGTPAPTGPQARLQGWAVVENASGSDWDAVRLALVSGEAAAFRQRIYDPITVPRPELPVRIAGAVQVRPDTGGRPIPLPSPPPAPMASRKSFAAAPQMARRAGAPDAPVGGAIAGTSAPAGGAVAEASAGRVAFVLAEPVTIRSGGKPPTSPSSTSACRPNGSGGSRTSMPAARCRRCASATPRPTRCRTASRPCTGGGAGGRRLPRRCPDPRHAGGRWPHPRLRARPRRAGGADRDDE